MQAASHVTKRAGDAGRAEQGKSSAYGLLSRTGNGDQAIPLQAAPPIATPRSDIDANPLLVVAV
jgi:hypothetical protein